ncbi:MAG: sulfotransferase [Planctomycetota bacterium]
MIDHSRKRLFIVGCPRSGTTIFQAVLSTHSQIVSFPETDFVRSLIGLNGLYEFGSPRTNSRDRLSVYRRRLLLALGIGSLNGRARFQSFLREMGREDLIETLPGNARSIAKNIRAFSKILDCLADERNAPHWIEKTPDHLFYLNWIERYTDQCKVLHIIRRGEDVISSLYDAAMKYKDEHWHQNYSDVDRCIDRWLIAVRTSLNYLHHEDHYHVLYDQFMSHPEIETRKLCGFIDIEYQAKMVEDPFTVSNEIVRQKENWKAGLSGREGMKAAPSKFTKVFSNQQQRYISERIQSAGMQWEGLSRQVVNG